MRDFDFAEISTTEGAPSLRDFRKGGNSNRVQNKVLVPRTKKSDLGCLDSSQRQPYGS